MSKSTRSVITVLSSVFLACFVSWIYLRGRAASKPIKPPYQHAFLKVHEGRRPIVFLQADDASRSALEGLAQVARENNSSKTSTRSAGLWLDVRLNGSSDLVLFKDDVLRSGKPVEVATLDECRAEGIATLSEMAPSLRDTPLVLNLISRRPGMPQQLLKIWGENKPLDVSTAAIQSEADGIIKELRESTPRGYFGSSQATLIQLEVLSSLSLEGLTDLKSDLLISFIKEGQGPRIRDSTLREAHRRGLKRYAGPVESRSDADALLAVGYDGLILTERGIWESLLDVRPQNP